MTESSRFNEETGETDFPTNYIASIVHRRRGIWLASCSETSSQVDEWDAFGTLAEAKRWCCDWIGVSRLKWREHSPGAWIAEYERYE